MITNVLPPFYGSQCNIDKKLCYREEHSASVVYRWSTVSHLLGENLLMANQPLSHIFTPFSFLAITEHCGLAMQTRCKKVVPPAARLGLGLPLVGVAVRIELGLGL